MVSPLTARFARLGRFVSRWLLILPAVLALSAPISPAAAQEAQPAKESKEAKLSRIDLIFLRHVEKFLNGFEFLEGRFEQTNPNKSTVKGRFYMRNDGRLRFSYDDPNTIAIISNGSQIGLVNKRTAKPEGPLAPLGFTPLSILTKRPVDLRKNTRIINVEVEKTHVAFTVAERGNEGRGSIQLYFNRKTFRLLGWIVREANGSATVIRLEELVEGKKSDPRLFVIKQYN